MKQNRWGWFLAADVGGNWLVTQGIAYVQLSDNGLNGQLAYEDSTGATVGIHADIDGVLTSDGRISMTVSSADAPAYLLSGDAFQDSDSNMATMVFTDGTTVLGLTQQAS